MYSPRLASPCASPWPNTAQRRKSPAAAGPHNLDKALLLLAEIVVAAAAGLADRANLRLDGAFVTALRYLLQLLNLGGQAVGRLLELARVVEYRGQRGAFRVLGGGIEAIPRHLGERRQVVGVTLHDFGIERHAPLGHAPK